jgi:TetR/AcrR family transcriptional regulator, biofilm operon repressor
MTKKEQVKQQIGAAAMQCFSRYGLEKTTLDDIARAVGLNKASLYYYYKNKEDIFLEVALREGSDYLRTLHADTLTRKTIIAQALFYLEQRIHYYRHVLNMNKVNADTLQRILPRFFDLYEDMMKEEIRFVEQLLKDAVKRKELVKTDTAKLAASFINISDALKHSTEQKAILKNEAAVDYSSSIEELKFIVQLILKGLTAR